MKTSLLTGASGFIGSHFATINANRFAIRKTSLQQTAVEDIDLAGVNVVVHLAGIAHRMQQTDGRLYYEVNHQLTHRLALRAKAAGVPHFLFMSTVKVYGDKPVATPLTETTTCVPDDDYGKSKFLAEEALRGLEDNNFTVSIVRTPVVYGPGVKGNLFRIMKLASKPFPLPFGNIDNQRSMVYIGNLIALMNCIIEQKAGGVFLPGDKEPVSTSGLVRAIRRELGVKAGVFPLPPAARFLLKTARPGLHARLFGSLAIDSSRTNEALGFVPPYEKEYGIREMARWFKGVQ